MRLILMTLCLGLSLITVGTALARSSEVPERREFPVNPEINPCQDFYQYACSKVIDSFQLREDRSAHCFSFSDSSERILDAKKKYFATLSSVKPQNEREGMLKTTYLACMDEKARRKEELELVKETRAKLNDLHTREEFLAWLAANRLNGHETPLVFGVENNQDRPTYLDVEFHTLWKSLPEKPYYEKPEVVADLEKLITDFYNEIGESHAANKARQVVAFEKGLIQVFPNPVERRDLQAARTSITRTELLAKYPSLQLGGLLARLPESTHFRDMMPKVMVYLNEKLSVLPLDELKSLYLYYALRGELDDAYAKFFNEKFAFENRHFGGPAVRPERGERCTREAMWRFMPEVDSILWPKMFPNFPREKVVELSERIRGAILKSLHENKWLSKDARREASAKIKTATLQLVAPLNDEEWNFRPLAAYDLEKPIANKHLFAQKMIERDLQDLQGPISPKRWGMGPLTVNAYYDEAYNKFVLPVGILQYPFYDGKGRVEVNLAAVGTVIGHELGHGIDDKGSLYDSKGLLRSWMSKGDLEQFRKRTGILVAQFNAAGMNGPLTLGENIGDLVGLTASHLAAFGSRYQKKNRSVERDFFTQYARAWCEVQRPKYAEMRIQQNPHALSVERVNEQIRQQPAFREAFACKDGDPMVLANEKIVHLW